MWKSHRITIEGFHIKPRPSFISGSAVYECILGLCISSNYIVDAFQMVGKFVKIRKIIFFLGKIINKSEKKRWFIFTLDVKKYKDKGPQQ